MSAGHLKPLFFALMLGLGLAALGSLSPVAADPENPPAAIKPPPAKEVAGNPVVVPPKKEAEVANVFLSTKNLRRFLSYPSDKLRTGVDKGTPLRDALDFICRIHETSPGHSLTYRIDHKAFADAGEPNIDEKQVELPPMPKVPLSVILDDLLSRIDPPEARGTFRIVGDFIEITTLMRLNSGVLFDQLIDVEIDKRPLAEALQDVMDKHGVTIALDGSVGDKAKFPITTTFDRVPLQTVVRLMANMADLDVVPVENMLYVTSKDKAAALRKENKRWQKDKQGRQVLPGGGA